MAIIMIIASSYQTKEETALQNWGNSKADWLSTLDSLER